MSLTLLSTSWVVKGRGGKEKLLYLEKFLNDASSKSSKSNKLSPLEMLTMQDSWFIKKVWIFTSYRDKALAIKLINNGKWIFLCEFKHQLIFFLQKKSDYYGKELKLSEHRLTQKIEI